MADCKGCGHRLSLNVDGKGRIIEGYHHKHGHGKSKTRHRQIRFEPKCPCESPEPKVAE